MTLEKLYQKFEEAIERVKAKKEKIEDLLSGFQRFMKLNDEEFRLTSLASITEKDELYQKLHELLDKAHELRLDYMLILDCRIKLRDRKMLEKEYNKLSESNVDALKIRFKLY